MSTPAAPSLLDRLSTNLLRILPQHLLAAGMYHLARSETRWLKKLLIEKISKRYGVDMSEAANPDLDTYPSFNAFFTRELKEGARPIAPNAILSPADGKVSQIGAIEGNSLLQAKGHNFDLTALLAGDKHAAQSFENGLFATVYLSPKDYHRVHIPFAGKLTSMVFVPGDLFSVSEATTQLVPGLFARNERVICHFDTDLGPMAVILVGAIFVGSMQTVWHGEVRGERGQPIKWTYQGDRQPVFNAGDEIGRFNMGSTVIVLLPANAATWSAEVTAGSVVRMGQAIATPTDA